MTFPKLKPSLVTSFLRKLLGPSYRSVLSELSRDGTSKQPRTRKELHEYWTSPPGDNNVADNYASDKKVLQLRSQLLVSLVEECCSKDAKILEIGCNVGRNLHYLDEAGYTNLNGIEISQKAVDLMRKRFPKVAQSARILIGPVEEKIKELEDGEFDLVFTMAVLEHIHTESEWIFQDMVRISKSWLITLEDEGQLSWRHFPRNYRKVFEPLGLKELRSFQCATETHGLNPNFQVRVFSKV